MPTLLFNHAARHAVQAFFLIALLATGQGLAEASQPSPGAINLDEVQRGTLLARPASDAAGHVPLPTVDSRIRVQVTGPIARTTLRQRFQNPSDDWVEAVYAFPLPEDAAVDRMQLRIGERVIEGEIQERARARATYEQARDAGRRSALVEQQRPNLFTTDVANIPPGSAVTVEIEYQHMVGWRDGTFSLRVPLAITPRYAGQTNGEAQKLVHSDGSDGWLILPGEVDSAASASADGRVDLAVTLDTGFPLAKLESHHHAIERETLDDEGGTRIRLETATAPDRDFVLSWQPQRDSVPRSAFFTEEFGGQQYGLFMLMPPTSKAARTHHVQREVVFVLDVSGSMAGQPIRSAKAALKSALRRMDWQDHFNVVLYHSDAEAYASTAQRATRGAIEDAVRWVDRASAGGGTEMREGLLRALATRNVDADAERLRQIVFITDGAITNHQPLFRMISDDLGEDRLFTVGIGHAPNTHLMSEMAHLGRGSSTFIANADDVRPRMDALLRQLETPALTDLALTLPVPADVLPAPLPDLYTGEPLHVVMKLDQAPHRLRIDGHRGDTAWQQSLALPAPAEQSGIAQAWARAKLRHWQRKKARGADPELVREASLALALTHRLVSPYTSLVAVDKTPARVREAMLKRHAVDRALPHGMRDQRIQLAQTATPTQLLLLIAAGLMLLAALLWGISRRQQAR